MESVIRKKTNNQEQLTVGKFTLESLTTGMYSDPMTIFREYIQNSCDSIDVAVKERLLKGRICKSPDDNENGKIHIIVNGQKREIILRDNGTGIQSVKAWKVLGDIGKSEKIFEEQRGFRGIGRLGGMSYCDELIFETSFYSEEEKTIIKWNCKELRELLLPGEYEEYDIIDVMELISSQSKEPAEKKKHYFEVKLVNVSEKYPDLLDEEKVKSYISQTAPIPFNPQQLIFIREIKGKFEEFGYSMEEYSIFFNDDPNRLTKPYKSLVVARKDKGKDKHHHIITYDIVKPSSEKLENAFIGWIGRRHKYNETIQIKNREISGIRLRKGNIQIGSNEILKDHFTEDRYNHYFIGEIHILSNKVIPNARRDNFEKAGDYPVILENIENITKNLSRIIRDNSNEKSYMKEVENAEELIDEAKKKSKKGFSSRIEQDEIFSEIDETYSKLKKISEKKNINSEVANKAKKNLKVINELENTIINRKNDNFILKKISSKYGRKERKIICRIFEILDSIKKDNPQIDENVILTIKNRILEEFK